MKRRSLESRRQPFPKLCAVGSTIFPTPLRICMFANRQAGSILGPVAVTSEGRFVYLR
jgi:hypothetical protein